MYHNPLITETFHAGLCCMDCALTMANDLPHPHNDDFQTGVAAWIDYAYESGFDDTRTTLVIGEDVGFDTSDCGVCGSTLHGDRHEFEVVGPR